MTSQYLKLICSIFLLSFIIASCSQTSPNTALLPPAVTPSSIPTLTSTATLEPTNTPIVYNVSISIVDDVGLPISNAKIIYDETINYTDKQWIWQVVSKSPNLSINVWAQGFTLQEYNSSLNAGNNKVQIQLSPDPLGLKRSDLEKEGYELVFIEDFQDKIMDCQLDGNGNIFADEANPENYLLLVDLRNLDQTFDCAFGPKNIKDGIIEVEFQYPEIIYNDFKDGGDYHWQGYFVYFRDNFDVEGYPLQPEWGPTLQIRDFSNNDEWKFPITVTKYITEDRWYRLNVKFEEQKIEVRMDDTLIFNYLNPNSLINTSQASFGAFARAYITFDNIKLWVKE